MEIKNTRTPPQPVAFSTIKPGETFISGANLLVKTNSTGGANAVILSDGRVSTYGQDDEVIPCKAYVMKET